MPLGGSILWAFDRRSGLEKKPGTACARMLVHRCTDAPSGGRNTICKAYRMMGVCQESTNPFQWVLLVFNGPHWCRVGSLVGCSNLPSCTLHHVLCGHGYWW